MTDMKKILFSASLLFLLFACSKDRSVDTLNADQTKVSGSGARFGSEAGQNIVHIVNSTFSPDSLMININSTLSWVNDDNTPHTVTSDRFDSGEIPPGAMFKYTFDNNTGPYYYHCKNHGETGVVVVAGIR